MVHILLVDLISSEIPRAMAGHVFASGPPLVLAAKIVQPIALALHVERAEPWRAFCTRWPSQSLVEIQESRTLLHWQEKGKHRSGKAVEAFGLGLIRGVIERQLRGTVKLDWTEDGLDAWMTFDYQGLQRSVHGGRSHFRAG